MCTSHPFLSCFPQSLLRFATVSVLCLLLSLLSAVIWSQEGAEQLFTDEQWTEASERSSIAAPGNDLRSASQEGGQVQTSMLRMVSGLVFVIALALLIAWLVRRSGLHRRLPGQRGDHLEVIESLSLGPKRGVSLLRVGAQFVLVGHNEQSMAALGSFDHLSPSNESPGQSRHISPVSGADSTSAVPETTSPQVSMVQEGDRYEGNGVASPPEESAQQPQETTDSVDDFRQRLNRLLGGRS